MNEQFYFEHLLAPILGFTRADLRYLRGEALKKNVTWMKLGREVVISQTGLDLILARVRASSNAPSPQLDFTPALVPQPEKKEPQAEGPPPPLLLTDRAPAPPPPAHPRPGELVELTVKSCYPNPRLLRAATPEGAIVDVQVRNNKNFVVNMKLKARQGSAGKWEMEGRCPRQRGRY